jgi:putative peptidoglycan lipid II flippase
MTHNALVAYSFGLLGLILIKVLAPGFYARQNIKTPVKIAVITLAVTQLMNLAFIVPLQHTGLALAISLGACFNASLLYYKLRSHQIYQPQPGWLIFFSKVLVALVVMAAVLWFSMGSTTLWLENSSMERIIRLTWVVALGATSYFTSLWLFGIRLKDFSRRGIE